MSALHKVTVIPWFKNQVQVVAVEPVKKGEIALEEDPLISIDLQLHNLPQLLEKLLLDKDKLEEFESWNLFNEKKGYELASNINQLIELERKFNIPHKEFKRLWGLDYLRLCPG
jgi:hypothetical protein